MHKLGSYLYSATIVWGLLVVGSLVTSALIVEELSKYLANFSPSAADFRLATQCTPVNSGNLSVGGLGDNNVPKLPNALRVDYTQVGASKYIVPADTNEVLSYYLPQLAANCWKLSGLEANKAWWSKDGQSLAIAVKENPYGGKSLVDYQLLGGRILGVTSGLLAQTDSGTAPPPPPPNSTYQQYPSGSPYPSGSTTYPSPYPTGTTTYPSPPYPSGSTTYPSPDPSGTIYPPGTYSPGTTTYPIPTQCSSGQYWCNNQCVADGTSCNGYPYYKPGDTIPTQPYPTNYPVNTQPLPAVNMPMPSDYPRSDGQGQFTDQGNNQANWQTQIDAQRLKMMKEQAGQFIRGISEMNKMVTRMEKRLLSLGVAIPAELKAALDQAPAIIEKIKAAQDPDEIEGYMSDLHDVTSAMQEWGPKFGDLMRLGEMLKQANRQVREMSRVIKRVEGYAKRNEALVTPVEELKTLFNTMSEAVQAAKELAKTDPDSALEKLESDVYDKMEEFWTLHSQIGMIRNMNQGLAQARREITNTERKIKQLERSKKVPAEEITVMKEMLASLKAGLEELRGLVKSKAGVEEIMEAAEGLWNSFEELQNTMAEHGVGFYESQAKRGEDLNFELPDAFKFNLPPVGLDTPPGFVGGVPLPTGAPSGGFEGGVPATIPSTVPTTTPTTPTTTP